MKRILINFLAVVIVIQTISCSKKSLNLSPVDQYSDAAVWNDASLIQTYVNNLYTGVPDGLSHVFLASIDDESMINITSETSNTTNSEISPSDLGVFGDGNSTALRTSMMNWVWQYKFIRDANVFFSKIDDAPIDIAIKNECKGEVYFLRAYFYFNLVSVYGGVPIITKPYGLQDSFLVARNTLKECFDFISSELDSASSFLPLNQDGNNIGRATKGAAMALKSRVLLYAASDFYNNSSWAGGYTHPELISFTDGNRIAQWQDAKDAAKAVMDLGIYSLYKPNPVDPIEAQQNYGDIFQLNSTSEDIFVKYFTTKYGRNWDGYNPGNQNAPNGYHGWGSNTPTGQLVDAYEMNDGSKFDWNNSIEAANPYANRDPRFYASILYNGAQWKQRTADVQPRDPLGIIQTGYWEKWNGNGVDVVGGLDTRLSSIENWNGGYTGYYLKKYMDPTIDATTTRQNIPWRYIRYTEVLLNYAEACLGLGQETEAKSYINMIRKRAGMPDITESGQALINRYRHERQIEMAYEDQRFFDVRRWMIADQAYTDAMGIDVRYKIQPDHTTAITPTYTVIDVQGRSWNPRFYLLPISLDEMNKNNKLIQNPLY